MDKKKKFIVSIIIVILITVVVSSVTYAYLSSLTNEGVIDNTGSGELSINYQKPSDLTGNLSMSASRDSGLKAVASASLNEGSVDALFNMYITPKALTNLNIPALKWEVEGVRNGSVVCTGSGDFSNAVVDTKFKILDGCKLSTDVTTFTVYIWLDSSLITTSVGGAQFDAKIGADSVPITGGFDKLPSEYQEVQYIESTGTQYLELDYIASNITNSKGTYQLMSTDTAKMLFGSRTDVYTNVYSFNWGSSQPWKYYNSYYSGTAITSKEIDLNKHTFEKKGVSLYIDDVLINSRTDVTSTFKTPYKMIVFGCNTNGTIGLQSEARIFELKFYDDNILKIDLVPCYRISDGVIGMYDLVNDDFYTNAGTGEFLKGNDV